MIIVFLSCYCGTYVVQWIFKDIWKLRSLDGRILFGLNALTNFIFGKFLTLISKLKTLQIFFFKTVEFLLVFLKRFTDKFGFPIFPSLRFQILNYSFRDRNFCVDIVNLERFISISYEGTFNSEDQCLIPQL